MPPNQTSKGADWPIAEGMIVYDRDGEKLGAIRNYNPQLEYLDVRRGRPVHPDFYVPLSAVQAILRDASSSASPHKTWMMTATAHHRPQASLLRRSSTPRRDRSTRRGRKSH